MKPFKEIEKLIFKIKYFDVIITEIFVVVFFKRNYMINVFIIKCIHLLIIIDFFLKFFVFYCFNIKFNHYMLLFLVSLEQSNFLERKTHLVIGQEELIDTFLAYAKGIDPVDLKIEGKYINEMSILFAIVHFIFF